jgi:manganese/zinc/iron transport system substrate-binding protein
MKTFVINFLIIFFLMVTFSCNQNQIIHTKSWMKKNDKLKILSTTEMINDLVTFIGGEYTDCLTLIYGGLDPHTYELVKGDDEKFVLADIVFANGLNLEHGACLINTINNHSNAVFLGDEIIRKFPKKVLIADGVNDPHIWMDMSLWVHIIDPIVLKIVELDPKNKKYYLANAKKLRKKILKAHREVLNEIQTIPSNKRYLVTSHDAFHYFARAYLAEQNNQDDWKERFSAPEGLAPDSQMSSVNILNIINYLKDFNIKVLFPESNVSQDSIQKIILSGRKKGLNLKISDETLYGDAMEIVEDNYGDNYINMMKHNARVLCKHLKAK